MRNTNKLAVILISLMAMVLPAKSQDMVRRAGVEDIRYKVGTYTRPSRLTSGATITLNGFTPINALAFGADNTGATSAADSLNAIIQTVGAAGGGTIYLPPGTYNINKPIVIDQDNVTLMGDGSRSTIIRPTWITQQNAIRIVGAQNVTVTRMGVKGAIATGPTIESSGFSIEGGRNNTISFCWADSCDNAGILVGYDIARYFALTPTQRANPDTVRSYGIDGVGHIIIGNVVTNTSEGSSIEIMRADSCVISNNVLNKALSYAIRVDGAYGATITGNAINGSGGEAISIQGYGDVGTGVIKSPVGVLVDGNIINCTYGIKMFNGATDVIISDNIIRCGLTGAGIILDKYHMWGEGSTLEYAWKNVVITDNAITSGLQGILVQGQGDGLVIKDNSIGEFGAVAVYLKANTDSMTISNAIVGGNRIWRKDAAPSDAVYGVLVYGDSIYVTLDRNQFSFPTTDSWQFYGSDYPKARGIWKYVKMAPHFISDFGVTGTNSATEIERFNRAIDNLYYMSGGDSTVAFNRGVDLYFPAGTYPTGSINVMLKPVRAVGPGVPAGLIGGMPRQLSGLMDPDGAIAAPIGSIYQRADNDSIIYFKTAAGLSGWVVQSIP